MKPRRENMLLRLCLLVGGALAASISTSGSAEPVLRRVTFREDFTSGSLDAWQFPFPEDWGILSEGPLHYLHMKRSFGENPPVFRERELPSIQTPGCEVLAEGDAPEHRFRTARRRNAGRQRPTNQQAKAQ